MGPSPATTPTSEPAGVLPREAHDEDVEVVEVLEETDAKNSGTDSADSGI